ncbi:hypothetical protein PT974_02026 [Cladobotryum mycophilum]|uniref:Uncharacterized protein n=1 Tax=Cladobotryum mycophilum TaxID=491253 RepID=A0ABR0SWX3_9HYPO
MSQNNQDTFPTSPYLDTSNHSLSGVEFSDDDEPRSSFVRSRLRALPRPAWRSTSRARAERLEGPLGSGREPEPVFTPSLPPSLRRGSDDVASSQLTRPLDDGEDADDEAEEDDEDTLWDMIDEIYPTGQSPSPVAEMSQFIHPADPPSQSDDENAFPGPVLRFDDNDVEHLSDDSDLDWENAPFDYIVPFDRPILNERYAFEDRYPNAAPIIRALMNLPATGTAAIGQVRNLQGRVVETYHEASERLDQVAEFGRYVTGIARRNGVTAAGEALQRGQDLVLLAREYFNLWGVPLVCWQTAGWARAGCRLLCGC